jgi:hypothetical protein
MERETVIIDLPATSGPEVRPVNRNYVARVVPRVFDLLIEPTAVEPEDGGLAL